METIRNIAAAGVEQLGERTQDTSVREEGGTFSGVKICYTMNSGRKVYRSYYMDMDKNLPLFEKLYASEAYQKASFPLMRKRRQTRWRISAGAAAANHRRCGLTPWEKQKKRSFWKPIRRNFLK